MLNNWIYCRALGKGNYKDGRAGTVDNFVRSMHKVILTLTPFDRQEGVKVTLNSM